MPYAASGIPEYWIVHLAEAILVRHHEPTMDGYQQCEVLPAQQSLVTRCGTLDLNTLFS